MCLLMLAWQAHPRYRLVVAANRDEYHERPAAPLAKWPLPAELLAGRDLRAQGTWLGVDRRRRFGVVTNFRELQRSRPDSPSRGSLVPRYLGAAAAADAVPRAGESFAALEPHASHYSGFNLLLTDADSLWYGSNRAAPFARALSPGVYGLANELLDTPWPKLERVRGGFAALMREPRPSPGALFALLADRTQTLDAASPAPTGGLPAQWARVLSAPFVLNREYGTRCSTVLLLESDGGLYLAERRFDPAGELTGETEFVLGALEWP
ncbi:MAG TPA: NRDE family protein [Steroidobacteraceae bacterium]|nr:NRDE family protein [Steroidobacteraceae bacterium]